MYIWWKKIFHCLPPRPHCILFFWFSLFHLLSLHILDFINKWSCSHRTFSSVSNLLPHMWFMATISTPYWTGAPPEWGHGVLRLLKEFDNRSSRMQEYSSTLICWEKSSHVTIRGLIFLYSLIPVWRCILTPMHYAMDFHGQHPVKIMRQLWFANPFLSEIISCWSLQQTWRCTASPCKMR